MQTQTSIDDAHTLITRMADLSVRIRCVVANHDVIDPQRRRDTVGGEEGGGAGKERRGNCSLRSGAVGGGLAPLSDSDSPCVATGEGVESWRGPGAKTSDTRSSGEVSRLRGSS
jgi:hypothetical protein